MMDAWSVSQQRAHNLRSFRWPEEPVIREPRRRPKFEPWQMAVADKVLADQEKAKQK